MGRRGRRASRGPETEADEPPPIVRLLTEMPVATVDLHGLTSEQARRRLSDFVRSQSRVHHGRVVHVITGKGSRSSGPAVLPGVARDVLEEERALVAEVAGLPGGGALAVRLT